jgi:hypothetical protein
MKRLLCGFAAWVLLVGLTGSAQAQYNYTTLDVPGGVALSITSFGNLPDTSDWAKTPGGARPGVDRGPRRRCSRPRATNTAENGPRNLP